MTKKNKKMLIRIIISSILFIVFYVLFKVIDLNDIWNNKYNFFISFGVFFVIYLIIAYDVLRKCFLNIIHLSFLDETFLMTIATIGAFSLGLYCGFNNLEIEGFDEAVAVMIFFQIGELFQSIATRRTRMNVSKLMNLRPDSANLVLDGGKIEVVDPSRVKIGDVILVMPGDKVPLDGILYNSESSFDTKAITGESNPRDLNNGDYVYSGFINISNKIYIKVEKEFSESTVAKILELVENASNNKSKTENFITRFSKFYTPIVVILAIMLGVIPSIITKDYNTWIYRALCFLVVSCPCALVISVPLAFFVGIGVSSKYGILVKGTNYLEKIKNTNVYAFDKTGTLTKGSFKISKIYPNDEVLYYAKIAEEGFNHPIAKSICGNEKINNDYKKTNIIGEGIIAKGEYTIYCGNHKLMEHYNIKYEKVDTPYTIIYVAKDNDYLGYIIIEDEIKEDTISTIKHLNTYAKTYMLTGDNEAIAKNVGERIGISEVKANLLPIDKNNIMKDIIDNKNKNDVVLYVGDGINDAPVLMAADIGVSMGNLGDDAAIEASDVILMEDNLSKLITLRKISKKTMRIVYENIIFAIGVKVLILILASFGLANMWLSVFGDVGVSVIAILNALRVNAKYE